MEIGEGSSSKGDPGEIARKIRADVDRKKVLSLIDETECCIFIVPKLLREFSADAYTPKVVSIGPYHRMDERLESMERFKLQNLDDFFDLSTGGEGESSHDSPTGDEGESIPSLSIRVEGESTPSLSIRVEGESIPDLCMGDEEESISDLPMELKQESDLLLLSCVENILEKEDEIRGSYADHISLSRDDFVQMVLLDSVFIIGSLRILSVPPSECDSSDWHHHKVFQLAENEIRRDLLLLENQLPLFIIHEIYNIRYPAIQGTTGASTFGSIVADFFNIDKLPPFWPSFGNLLNLVRRSFIGSYRSCQNEEPEETPDKMSPTPSNLSPTASNLHAAGVKFNVADEDYSEDLLNLLEIKFDKEKGVLTIPKLIAEDPTQSMFRNMIAMEQCMYLYKEPTYITDYFYFLDCLINTEEDVQLLADQGIVENSKGSDVVCRMFNDHCNYSYDTWIPCNYSYKRLSKELNDHCSKKRNKWMAMLKNKYFAHPWACISVIYAIVLLLLTIAQVILAILALPGVLKISSQEPQKP